VVFGIWSLAISGATLLSLWQCSVSVQKYMSNPKTTLFSMALNASLVPPSVTVCPEPPYSLVAELQLYESYNLSICGKSRNSHPSNCTTVIDVLNFIYEQNITLGEALSRLAYRPEEIVRSCFMGGGDCRHRNGLCKPTLETDE
jgi:hypothetical protein